MDYGYIQRVAPPPYRDQRPSAARFFSWVFVCSSAFWPRLFILGLLTWLVAVTLRR